MAKILLPALIVLFSFTTFGQSGIFTVFEGVRIKDSHRDEALFYYRHNWARLRERAFRKGLIDSYELIESHNPAINGFDIGLITRFKNKSQYEKAEEDFRSLINSDGPLKLLNDLKPPDFRENSFVISGDIPKALTAAGTVSVSTKKIALHNEGWEIFGDLTVPLSNGPFPVVVLLNKAYGDRGVYKGLADRLAGVGVAAVRVDLRAHGESVNKGRFGPPFDENMRSLLKGTEKDIVAIQAWIRNQPQIDQNRIGFVGASYSGEEMVSAARSGSYAKAYVALSPGSFSEESMRSIDRTGIPWFFIKSVDEIALMNDVFAAIRANSKTARILEVSGKSHASDLLAEHPDLEEVITLWFKHIL